MRLPSRSSPVGDAPRGRADAFAVVFCGAGAVSVAGLALAVAGAFTTWALLLALGAVGLVGLGIARRRAAPRDPEGARAARAGRVVAGAAGLIAVAWCWPPFETVMAGSDSTMYVNAGVHLARTGAFVVPDTAAALLSERAVRATLPSVSVTGRGPFIRLPGGLLMAERQSPVASPAFFPLVPVWTGVLALLGGPEAAPLVAPLFTGLAVWAVALFAAEAVGGAAAAAAGLLLIANFAVWWFGRFVMAEPLACAFVWAGLVFLGRGSPALAGAMLGIAGLARTETILFSAAAAAIWLTWTRAPVSWTRLVAGFVPIAAIGLAVLIVMPSHHLGYLRDDLMWHALWLGPRWGAAWRAGHVHLAAAGGVALLALVGVVGRRTGVGAARAILATLALVGTLGAVGVFVTLARVLDPARHLGWLATYCSWGTLVLALVGAPILWRRGGPAARLALLLALIVGVVFVPNPRVALWQPWAIRRFLPIVIPAITVAAAAALAAIGRRGGRLGPVMATGLALWLAAIAVRPVLAVRATPYYEGGFANARAIAARLDPDALTVVDAHFSDVQLQVPLWLVHGRETLVTHAAGGRWREVLQDLLTAGRTVYWVGNGLAAAPRLRGLAFEVVEPKLEPLVVRAPLTTADRIPRRTVRRLVPIAIYRVRLAPGDPAPARPHAQR